MLALSLSDMYCCFGIFVNENHTASEATQLQCNTEFYYKKAHQQPQ